MDKVLEDIEKLKDANRDMKYTMATGRITKKVLDYMLSDGTKKLNK